MSKSFAVNGHTVEADLNGVRVVTYSLGENLAWMQARKLADENKNSNANIHPMNRDYGIKNLTERVKPVKVKKLKPNKKRKRTK